MDLLPGLYVLALGIALAVLLKALGDSLPFQTWAIFGSVLLILLGPALVGGELLLPLDSLRGSPPFQALAPTEPHGNLLQGDLIQLVHPLRQQVQGELTAGRWPLWNPLAGAGMPLLSDPQAQPLQPLVLLAYPFDALRGAAVVAALRILIALAFCCALFRRLGLGDGPAMVGALAYGCGGFLLLWLGWPLANSAALLPAVLYGVAGCLDLKSDSSHPHLKPKRRWEIFLAVATASLLLAGHPETILYVGAFAGAFTGVLLLRQPRRGSMGKRLVRVGLPALVAMAAVMPILLPTAFYLPHAWRTATLAQEGGAQDQGVEGSPTVLSTKNRFADIAQAWVPLAAPNTFGNSRYVRYWGPTNSNEDSSGFVGTVTLLAAFLGVLFIAAGGRKLFPGEGLVLAVALLVLGILAYSAATGSFLVGLHGGGRLRMLFSFSVAYLAACALERVQGSKYREDRLGWHCFGWHCVLGVGAALAGLHFLFYFGFAAPEGVEGLRPLRLGWLHWHVRFLVAGVFLLAVARWRRWMPWAAALLVAGELLLAFQDANPSAPHRLAFPTPAPLAAVQQEGEEARLVALHDALPPNLGAVYGIGDARIYNPMEPAPYAALVAPLLEQPRKNVPRAVVADHPLYDLLGIDFVLTGPEVALPLPLVVDDATGRLYRRRRPLDVLFLPTTSLPMDEASWPAVVHGEKDFLELSRVMVEVEEEGAPWRAGSPSMSRLRGVRQAGPRVWAEAALYEDRLLASRLLAIGKNSGWRLVVNGVPQRTIRANGPLLAAWLPAGDHELNLLWRPPGFLLGCFLAALGLSVGFLRWWALPLPLEAVELKDE